MPRHFFIAGAQRCATTYLYRMLEQHPEITMAQPVRPEPKYFIRPQISTDPAAYREEFFAGARTDVLGEKSTSYIEHPVAAERIARMFPDATILFLLRDPVERALSNYRFSVMNGLETLPLEEALACEPARAAAACSGVSVSPFAYAARGHYVRHLDAWAEHLPRERMYLLTTEELVADTASSMRRVFESLQVDPEVALQDIGASVNASGPPEEASEAVRERLRAAFAESNRDLASRYGVSIGNWQ